MEFSFKTRDLTFTKDLPATEEAVMKEAGALLLDMDDAPDYIRITDETGEEARFKVGKRGTYVKDGVKRPSFYVTVESYGLKLSPAEYSDAYLTCINTESNNYKYYWLKPNNAGGVTKSVGATYGRIGSDRNDAFGTKDLQTPYEPYLYWIRYYEKLSKGYIDQTDIFLSTEDAKVTKDEEDPDDEQPVVKKDVNLTSAALYELLMGYAKHVVKSNLKSQTISAKQVEKAWEIWKELCEKKTLKEFNDKLTELVTLSPRKCRFVTELLAVKTSDFVSIINREESLINAMAACVTGKPVKETSDNTPSFDDFGIEVFKATDKQREKVMDKLSPELRKKVKNIYRVIPKGQKEKFNAYLKKNKIKKVKELWHGSRNENWFNIMKTSLSLNPNAVITGKMLGNGIYFAPSSMKSWGYTSYSGSYWAKGRSDTAFMGLFAAAYGTPLDVYSNIRHYSQAELDRTYKNCVHAHAGAGGFLRNDEIVFYDENALLLNYIVEFAA